MNFCDRLKKFREEELKFKTRKEAANLLGISQQLYAMLERGERNPSKKVLSFLVAFTGKPASYWIYGVEPKEEKYVLLDKNVNDLIDQGLIKPNGDFDAATEALLLAALRIDIKNLMMNNDE